jgi:hypothetical protein
MQNTTKIQTKNANTQKNKKNFGANVYDKLITLI